MSSAVRCRCLLLVESNIESKSRSKYGWRRDNTRLLLLGIICCCGGERAKDALLLVVVVVVVGLVVCYACEGSNNPNTPVSQ